MTAWRNGRTIKCDQKVNITATFGSDLLLEGSTSIPNILFKIYKQIGISDFQMILLVHLIRFSVEEKEFYPSPDMIAEYMESDFSRIKKELAQLLEKDIIAVSDYYDSKRQAIIKGYDFDPLFLKISDIWAGLRAREIEESEKLLRRTAFGNDFRDNGFQDDISGLLTVFESEFGRLLSPFEVEQIEQWAGENEAILVIEALKRAVLGGKHNFKYINSILLEWKKNNLRTFESIAEYDRDFQKRRSGRGARGNETGTSPKASNSKSDLNSNNDSTKKAFIRSLYVKG